MRRMQFRPSPAPTIPLPVAARSVGQHRIGPGWREVSHPRHFHQFLWCVTGSGEVDIAGRPHRLATGEVAFLRPGEIHRFQAIADLWVLHWFTIDGRAVEAVLDAFGITDARPRPAPVPCPTGSFRQLERVIAEPGAVAERRAAALTFSLLAAFAPAAPSPSDPSLALARRCRELIDRRAAEPGLGIAALASACAVHRATITRAFVAAYGCPPLSYLMGVRLRRALDLLALPEQLPISDVARRAGFSDPRYLARRLRQATGHSPTKLRQQQSRQPLAAPEKNPLDSR